MQPNYIANFHSFATNHQVENSAIPIGPTWFGRRLFLERIFKDTVLHEISGCPSSEDVKRHETVFLRISFHLLGLLLVPVMRTQSCVEM